MRVARGALRFGSWQMVEIAVHQTTITFKATTSACDARGEWQLALGLVTYIAETMVHQNNVASSAAISACEL